MKQRSTALVLGISLAITLAMISGCKTIPSSSSSSSNSSSSSSSSPSSSNSSSSSSSGSSSDSGAIPSSGSRSTSGDAQSGTQSSGMPDSTVTGSATGSSSPTETYPSGAYPSNGSSSSPGESSYPPYDSGSGYPVAGESTESGSTSSSGDYNTAGAASSGAGRVLSNEEQIEVLEGELDRTVAVFDGMILDERSTIQGIEDANQDQGYPGGNTDAPLFEEGDLAGGDSEDGEEPGIPAMPGAGSVEEPGTGEVIGTSGSQKGIPTKTASAGGAIPEDIKDGSDDDIVARQIREAAMKETDPELREKLWDEYRKYKNQNK